MDWYNAHAPGLGACFIDEVDATVGRIAESPLLFPVVHRDIRRARLHRFPYGLFFRLTEPGIHVLACFHSNRDPRRWQARN